MKVGDQVRVVKCSDFPECVGVIGVVVPDGTDGAYVEDNAQNVRLNTTGSRIKLTNPVVAFNEDELELINSD